MKTLFVLLCVLFLIPGGAYAASKKSPKPKKKPTPTILLDKNCSDFSSWAAAQKFFIAQGGPAKDPYKLDADHDGIACENLK